MKELKRLVDTLCKLTIEAYGNDSVDANRKKEDALKTERGQSRVY